MTWDASNLYVGIVNANVSEAAVIYIAGNPQTPRLVATTPTAVSLASTMTALSRNRG